MRFEWEKLGRIYDPTTPDSGLVSHAQVPFTAKFSDRIRVYFSTRGKPDAAGQFVSWPSFIDFSLENFPRPLGTASSSLLPRGARGDFDHFGAMGGSVVRTPGGLLMYYCGWDRGVSVPYNWGVGVALGNAEGTRFVRLRRGPILAATASEPFLFACPVVFPFEDHWRMFYLGGTAWFEGDERRMESQYVIRSARSEDGILWERDGRQLVESKVENESQTSATVIKIEDSYYMFFSYRFGERFRESSAHGYRIGLAVSDDFATWSRRDEDAGLDMSPRGWDSEMVAYPHLFSLAGEVYMLYCGNSFGRGGFGLARLKTPLRGKKWSIVSTDGDATEPETAAVELL